MIEKLLAQHREALEALGAQQAQLERMGERVTACLQSGGKVLLMGNGGSAADAQHIAAELVGRFQVDRPAFAAMSLTTDTSILTSVGNDYGFEEVFARQVEGLARSGDVVIGMSTSGTSANVIRGVERAAQLGCTTIGFLGERGRLEGMVDEALTLRGFSTARVQEMHILAGHILCELVERNMTA
jgi:D-sedoheptulose 7-phosphate isomerase